MIMHTIGGVYMDTDVECYADMTPWLAGADVVLQAEVCTHYINIHNLWCCLVGMHTAVS